MRVVSVRHAKDAITLGFSREEFKPSILCAVEDLVRTQHDGVVLQRVSMCDLYVVTTFSRPTAYDPDLMQRVFDAYLQVNASSEEGRSCRECSRKKPYCTIGPK
jgi:hypothetical protein